MISVIPDVVITTPAQLILAHAAILREYRDNPQAFAEFTDDIEADATSQVNNLLYTLDKLNSGEL